MINPNESRFVDFKFEQTVGNNQRDLFDKYLPSEIIISNIFSKYHFKTLLSLATVNKRFSILIDDPVLLKWVIFRDMTFNPYDWKLRFGEKSQGALDHDLSFKLLPEHIGAIFKGACPLNPQKKLGETHAIVWKPANLSVNNYVKLIKEKTKFAIEITKSHEQFDNLTEKGEWVVISKVSYNICVQELKDLCLPTPLEATLCGSANYLKYRKRIFGKFESTMCQGDFDSMPICVESRFTFLVGPGHYKCIAPVFKF